MRTAAAVHSSRLSAELQRALLQVPAAHKALRDNPFLDNTTWRALLRSQGSESRGMYLYKHPTRDRVRTLLRVTSDLGVSERTRSDIDIAISEWMLEHRLDARTLSLAVRCGLPNVANVVLRHPSAGFHQRRAVAPAAYLADRLVWLASPQADPLGDEEVWKLAELPDTLEDCCEGTFLDSELRRREVVYSAQLLHVRPALQPRAIAAGSVRWLIAAASVKLPPELQLQLLSRARLLDPSEERALGSKLTRSYDGSIVDAVSVLVGTPWCTHEVLASIAAEPTARVRVREDGRAYLQVDREYSYRNGYVLRSLDSRPTSDLRTAPMGAVETWLEHAEWSDALSAPYVVLETLGRSDLPERLRRQRRRAVHGQARAIAQVLARTPRWRHLERCAELTRYGSPDVMTPYTPQPAGPSASLLEAGVLADAGLEYLTRVLDETELVLALTLLFEGAGGTVGELADTARAVLAEAQNAGRQRT